MVQESPAGSLWQGAMCGHGEQRAVTRQCHSTSHTTSLWQRIWKQTPPCPTPRLVLKPPGTPGSKATDMHKSVVHCICSAPGLEQMMQNQLCLSVHTHSSQSWNPSRLDPALTVLCLFLGKTITKIAKYRKYPPAAKFSAMGMTPELWLEGKEISHE